MTQKETWEKFDEINYLKKFKPNIEQTHRLLEYALLKYRVKGAILDIGGGPGITAEILRRHKNKSLVYNIEPSKQCLKTRYKNYRVMHTTLKKAIEENKLPRKVDCLIASSSLHEIALANKKSNTENKRKMFEQVNQAVKRLRKGGLFIICFIEYKKSATDKEIARHMRIAEHTIGHDHPREETLSIPELKRGLKGMQLIETRRKQQTHKHKNQVSKIIQSKLAVFKK